MKIFLLSAMVLSFLACQRQVAKFPTTSSNHRASVLSTQGIKTLPGMISGQVLNLTNEEAISGAIVTIKKGNRVITTTVTDKKGKFSIKGLPKAQYHVTARAPLFGSLTIRSVAVNNGKEVTTHFLLTPAVSTDHLFISAVTHERMGEKS